MFSFEHRTEIRFCPTARYIVIELLVGRFLLQCETTARSNNILRGLIDIITEQK